MSHNTRRDYQILIARIRGSCWAEANNTHPARISSVDYARIIVAEIDEALGDDDAAKYGCPEIEWRDVDGKEVMPEVYPGMLPNSGTFDIGTKVRCGGEDYEIIEIEFGAERIVVTVAKPSWIEEHWMTGKPCSHDDDPKP